MYGIPHPLTPPNPNSLQVGDTDTDHSRWCRPEQCGAVEGPYRPTWLTTATKPGSDVVGEAVAALAAVAMVVAADEPASPVAAQLLVHARQLYAFGKAFPGA